MRYNAVTSYSFTDIPGEPVNVDDAKAWMKIDLTDDDTLITSLITTARILCESFLNMSIIQRTVFANINNTLGGVELPFCPYASMFALTNSDGRVFDTDEWKVTNLPFACLQYPKEEFLTAVYTAGYQECPEYLRTAILVQIAFMYENRGDVETREGRVYNLCELAKQMLSPFRRVS